MEYITFDDVLKTYKSREAGIKALSKHKHWFPIKLSPRIAGIVADLTGDGHLQHPPMWRMDYTSASREELGRFNNEIKELFDFSGYIRPVTQNAFGKSYLLAINCNPIGRIMSLCGVPRGAKVLVPFDIPQWIAEDKECFRRFIMRLFDCEGTVDQNGGGIELRMSKEVTLLDNGVLFFNRIKEGLLEHFNIATTAVFFGGRNIRKDGRETNVIHLKIKRHSEIIKFYQEINFENKIKQGRLFGALQKVDHHKNVGREGFSVSFKPL